MPGMDAMPMEMGESPGGIDKKLSGNHDQKTRFFIKPNLMQPFRPLLTLKSGLS